MARRSISIDEKIQRAEAEVVKYKEKYEEALTELKKLVDRKKELQSAELLNAIEKSKRSYEEILIFLNGVK